MKQTLESPQLQIEHAIKCLPGVVACAVWSEAPNMLHVHVRGGDTEEIAYRLLSVTPVGIHFVGDVEVDVLFQAPDIIWKVRFTCLK